MYRMKHGSPGFSGGFADFSQGGGILKKGEIDPKAKADCELSLGAMERWNGHLGFGPLNAKKAMDRAVELAKQYGIGIVALGNNNHWMRGRHLWLAGGRPGLYWYLLVQYLSQYAGMRRS